MEQPERLGKYQIISKLGAGATSTVYLAHDEFVDRDVAIKVLNPEILNAPEMGKVYRRQLHAEASLAGRLSHPHIVAIYDAVIDAETCYIVMEYVRGGTLEKYSDPDNLLEIPRVVEIVFKCCRALNYAQFNGVIHRDIKPANILLNDAGEVKVSDLGAAIVLDLEQTQVDNIGSPGYMSPEQVRGEVLTHQTDIYSLGVVMYRLLTGRSPYTAKNLAALTHQILNGEVIPMRSLRPELPVSLERIVGKAMQRDRSQRYQDWKSFGADLAAAGPFEQKDMQQSSETSRFVELRRMALFEDFTDVELWEILRIGEWQQHPAKTVLMKEGSQGEDIYIITEGMATVTRSGRLLNTIRAGESFGEMAYVTGKSTPRSATVSAATAVTVMKLAPFNLTHLSDHCQLHFNQAFLRIMADRLRVADDRFATLLN